MRVRLLLRNTILFSCLLALLLPLGGCAKKEPRRQRLAAQADDGEIEYPYVDPRFGSERVQGSLFKKNQKRELKEERKEDRFDARRRREIRQKYGYTY